VDAVVDHLAGQVCRERRGDDSRLAMVQWPHPIEQVGRERYAGVDRRLGVGVPGVGVAHRGDCSGREHLADQVERAGQFGRDGDAAQGAAGGGGERGERGRVRQQQVARVLGAAAGG